MREGGRVSLSDFDNQRALVANKMVRDRLEEENAYLREKLVMAEAALNWLDRKMMSSPDMGGNHHYVGSVNFRLNDDSPMAAYWRTRE